MSSKSELVFNKVKPLCINVTKSRTKYSIEQLQNFIKQLSADVVQDLHEYLLFPLRVILVQQPKAKEDFILAAAGCMQCVFKKVQVQKWKTFEDLYLVLITQITSSDQGKIVSSGSEDKKLSILFALEDLLHSSLVQHCKLFYEVNHISAIGHLITICLSIITNEKNKLLRKVSISVIEVLALESCSVSLKESPVLQYLVGNCIAFLLPGLLSVLVKVVSGDIQQGYSVKCKAIDTITKLIKIAGGDEELKTIDHPDVMQYLRDMNVSDQFKSFVVQRNSDWVKNVGAKMNVVLDHVATASDHSNVHVRMSILSFSCEMLVSCRKGVFKDHIGSLLKIPCKLISDDLSGVTSESWKVINCFSECCKDEVATQDILQEELFESCDLILTTVSKASDSEKLSHLKTIYGFLKVLKYNLKSFAYSSVHVSKLFKSLLFCLQMDSSSLHKIGEVDETTADYDSAITSFFKGQSNNWLFKKSFIHFHSDELCRIIIEVCRLLGQYGDIDIFLDHLKEYYDSENLCRPTVLLINELLLGTKKNNAPNSNLISHVETLIDLYTANDNWYLCTSHDSLYVSHRKSSPNNNLALLDSKKVITTTDMTLKMINSNIILVCLHLEALSTFSLVLINDYRQFLIKVLYPLLEKVNDSNHLISSCALKALHVVASSCRYKSIAELITMNADYLVSTISIHLRHLNLFPRSPAVLRAMMTHSDVSVFPLVRDTVDEILSTLDLQRHNKLLLVAFLPVMKAIASAINDWFPNDYEGKTVECRLRNTDLVCPVQEITDTIVNFYNDFKLSSLEENEHSSVNNNFETAEDEKESISENHFPLDEKKEISAHIKVVEQILLRSSHLLTNPDPRMRLLVIDIIDKSIDCLRTEEDVFLPLVHKMWNPLTSRCRDSELQVVAKAFSVICRLGEHCGSFIRSRFTKDVMPYITVFLRDNSDAYHNSSSVHCHSTLFKLQVVILDHLGSLLRETTVSYKDIDTICCASYRYLSSAQPEELQNAALSLYKTLISINSDAIWLFLSDIWSPAPEYSFFDTNPTFYSFKLAGTSDVSNEFSLNFIKLLESC